MGKRPERNRQARNKTGKQMDAAKLARSVLNFLDNRFGQGYAEKKLAKKLNLKDVESKKALGRVLQQLVAARSLKKSSRNEYFSTKTPEFLVGVVDYVNPRFAFVIPEGQQKSSDDVMVKESDLKNALDGDKVRIMVFPVKGKSERREGRVEEVLARERDEFVGRVEISPRFAFVVPDFKKIHHDIFIKKDDLMGAQHNQKVVVKITEWRDGDKNPTGKIIRILGEAGEHEVEIHSIMAEFGLPFEYPEAVVEEANAISDRIDAKDIKNRRDFRGVPTLTIDPADAKDFDDAISYQKLPNGNHEIGIHIADVTHYVKLQTLMEKEAYDRATSVYLVDRTIPMLPERLSNVLCSLRPNEDKLTFSCVFEMDDNGDVLNQWLGRTLIHSDRRFAYEEAQENIDKQEGDFYKELTLLNGLAKKLRTRRFQKGAINFETTEVRFKLAEDGTPLGLIVKERKDVHKLIEEFMLLANRTVAEFVYHQRKGKDTFVYRIHDHPDLDKLSVFAGFAKKFGHNIHIDEETNLSFALNSLMDEIQGKPEQNVLEQLAIRSMAKARYTTEAKGHFGLAFKHYTHFTSPIRRYPDMMVHRLLQHYLNGSKSPDSELYEEKCLHSSEREKRASDAERASIKYKQVEYMLHAEDKDYEGIVTGVTEWGVYVEIIETKCEGMVRLHDIKDDYYEFDEKNMRLIGAKNKRMITLGDQVTVRVVNADIDRRTIDLEFVK